MKKYEGVSCPVCQERFSEDDSVVVCPECGAPAHRECWEREKKCAFSELHSESFAWKKPIIEDENTNEDDGNSVNTCKACGFENPGDLLYCGKCGTPISSDAAPNSPIFGPAASRMPTIDPLGGVREDDLIDGVKAGELASFVGQNSPYFMRIFVGMSRKVLRVVFNFFAFFFRGAWFLSKKMYLFGTLFCSIDLIILIINALLSYFYIIPALSSLGDNYTSIDLFNAIWGLGPIVFSSYMIFGMLEFALMILCGLLGNSLYKKHCIKKISELPVPPEGSSRVNLLRSAGGTNLALAISVCVCYNIFSSYGIAFLDAILK